MSDEEGRYLRDVVRVPMGGQRGGPHRLVNPKTSTKYIPLYLAHTNCTPFWKGRTRKIFRTFAARMNQTSQKKYVFTQFAAFFKFMFTKINYYLD